MLMFNLIKMVKSLNHNDQKFTRRFVIGTIGMKILTTINTSQGPVKHEPTSKNSEEIPPDGLNILLNMPALQLLASQH